jgi:GWxTD domain-containing protein
MAGALVLSTVLLAPLPESLGQVVELSEAGRPSSPSFEFDAINLRGDKPGLSRIDIYIKVPNDELVFVKDDSGRFRARYEVSLVILDRDDFQMDGKIWKEEVYADNFDATNSRKRFHLTSATFSLPPEKYKITIGLTDLETGTTNFRKQQVELADFDRDELMLSDVLFADYVQPDTGGTLVLRPKVTFDKTRRAELFAYFEIYSPNQPKEFDIRYEISTKKGDRLLRDRLRLASRGERTGAFLRISTAKMVHGSYRLKLKVSDGKQTAEIKKPFLIRWEGIPPTVADLDLAIEQMRYIAEKGELKKLKKLSKDEKLRGFIAFWKERDPTPGTEANELLEEYFRRVNYADENFGTYTDGWKTDRGMVYITFGPPDDVERQPFPERYETDSQVPFDPFAGRAIKAKEYWIYYNRNLVLEFIDVTGYGEFKLRYPQIFYQYVR